MCDGIYTNAQREARIKRRGAWDTALFKKAKNEVRSSLLKTMLDNFIESVMADNEESDFNEKEIKYTFEFKENTLTIKLIFYFEEDPFSSDNLGIFDVIAMKQGKFNITDMRKLIATIYALALTGGLCIERPETSKNLLEMMDVKRLNIYISHQIRRYKLV